MGTALAAWVPLGMGLFATVGLTLAAVQWHWARRHPEPFPPRLRWGAVVLTALAALGAWDLLRQSGNPPLRIGFWTVCLAGMAVGSAYLLWRHTRSVRSLLQQAASASSGQFIEEQVLRAHLDQLRKSIAMQDALRDMQRAHLRSQMNPHFLFNVLTGIQNLLLEGAAERASEVFRRFRVLLMQGFLSDHDRLGTLEDELDHIRNYLELEEIRLPQPIGWSVVLGKALDPTEIACPLFLLQPLVENAIWHGLADGSQPHPLLEIHAHWDGDDLVLSVHDNGRGLMDRPPAQPQHAAFASRGTQIVRERLALLPVAGNLLIVPATEDGPFRRGTTSRIRLPAWRDKRPDAGGQKGSRGSGATDSTGT
jgi:LytS/YehU family sensor histidine kinase